MKRLLATTACFLCCTAIAVAQVPTTHAGKGSPGGGGGGGYQGPGDVTGWTTGVIAYWGLRGFNAAYSGKVANICDASTGATCADATWSSAGSGTLTLPTPGGFACDNATHQCEVAILYDTSGALSCTTGSAVSCDLSVAHGNRPLLVINCLGTKPCFTATSVNMLNANLTGATFSQPFTQTAVAIRTSGTGFGAIASGNGGTVESLYGSAANTVSIYAGVSNPSATATDGVWHTLNFVFDGTGTNSQIQVDAGASNSVSLGATATLGTSTTFHFPAVDNGALTGQLFEAGWWSGAKTANFSNMHTNQCTYWGTTC